MTTADARELSSPAMDASGLADALGERTGCWVLIERAGELIAHGCGRMPVPDEILGALITKRTHALRSAVRWNSRQTMLVGRLHTTPVRLMELGHGHGAWLVGADVDEGTIRDLAELMLGILERPPYDPIVEGLLHPSGVLRTGQAPIVLLVCVMSRQAKATVLARNVTRVAPPGARIHADGRHVWLALDVHDDAHNTVRLLRERLSDVHAGIALVDAQATDWRDAAELAEAAAHAAEHVNVSTGDLHDMRIAAEIVVAAARRTAKLTADRLPTSPIAPLVDYEQRSDLDLIGSLLAWIDHRFDCVAAAEQLHVHPNTLRYRLRRACELLKLEDAPPSSLLATQLLAEPKRTNLKSVLE